MTEPKMVDRWENVAGLTLADMTQWALQRGIDPNIVTVTSGHLKWKSPQTPEEAERSAQHEQASRERHEKWERETYDRLKAKYDGGR